ncbi:MAG: helix-turn-helix transcriptional regulator [Defluviitaleaceae bacterium]|nr:helix-turn-helix transcriptional regulator [Defluviitaleaceae bacterium]
MEKHGLVQKAHCDRLLRNEEIVNDYKSGVGIQRLAQKFSLSTPSIRKVLYNAYVYKGLAGSQERIANYHQSQRNERRSLTNHVKTKSGKNTRVNLIDLRTVSGMTQQEVSDKIGISRSYYARIENGSAKTINEGVWAKIESLFSLPTGYKPIKEVVKRNTKKNSDDRINKCCYGYVKIWNNIRCSNPKSKAKFKIISFLTYAILYEGWAYIVVKQEPKKRQLKIKSNVRGSTEIIGKYKNRPDEFPLHDVITICNNYDLPYTDEYPFIIEYEPREDIEEVEPTQNEDQLDIYNGMSKTFTWNYNVTPEFI